MLINCQFEVIYHYNLHYEEGERNEEIVFYHVIYNSFWFYSLG